MVTMRNDEIDALARRDRRIDVRHDAALKRQQDLRAIGFAACLVGGFALLVILACAGVVA